MKTVFNVVVLFFLLHHNEADAMVDTRHRIKTRPSIIESTRTEDRIGEIAPTVSSIINSSPSAPSSPNEEKWNEKDNDTKSPSSPSSPPSNALIFEYEDDEWMTTAKPIAAPTPEPSKATPMSPIFIEDGKCAEEHKVSFDCSGRSGPEMCCPGLVCHEYQFWKCVQDQHKTCAGQFSFATECGSNYKYAPQKCCNGLTCLGKKCVELVEVETCATENKRSRYCGAKGGKDLCCSELVCHEYQRWRCVKEDNKECSGEDTYSMECGSKYLGASPTCCDGLVCKDKKCVSPP